MRYPTGWESRRVFYSERTFVFTQSSALCTQDCLFSLAAAISPQLLLRHPMPQPTRGVVAPNLPFCAFCRSCQVPQLPIYTKGAHEIDAFAEFLTEGNACGTPFSPFRFRRF
jgi:hypothetical protein